MTIYHIKFQNISTKSLTILKILKSMAYISFTASVNSSKIRDRLVDISDIYVNIENCNSV